MTAVEAIAFASVVTTAVAVVSTRPVDPADTLFRDCLASGAANAAASALMNPMDVTKTRMQVEVRHSTTSPRHSGVLKTLRALHAEGGLRNMILPGLTASMLRELVGGSVRGGVYIPVRKLLDANGAEGSAMRKAAAAIVSGSIGAILSNPVEIVKVRLLADRFRYPSTLAAFAEICAVEGIKGMTRGAGPSITRGALINVGYLATYDHSKQVLLRWCQGKDSPLYHVAASLVSGLCATTVAAPFDMVKTRVMTSTQVTAWQAVQAIVTREGVASLFRGWLPAYMRLGPHALVCFPILEEVRRTLGLSYI